MGEELAKWVLLAYGLFMTTLVAGVVYGWQSFRAVFIAEGVLSEGCDANSADVECPSQAKELGLIFACGAWSVQACRMVTGLVRDRYGTRVCVVGVMLTVAVGIVLLAVSPPQSLAMFCVGYFLLGIGAGVQLCMQSISMLFGEYQGAASATLSGAFTLSGYTPRVRRGYSIRRAKRRRKRVVVRGRAGRGSHGVVRHRGGVRGVGDVAHAARRGVSGVGSIPRRRARRRRE